MEPSSRNSSSAPTMCSGTKPPSKARRISGSSSLSPIHEVCDQTPQELGLFAGVGRRLSSRRRSVQESPEEGRHFGPEVGPPGGELRETRGGAFFDTGRAGLYRVNDRPFAVSAAELAGPLDAGGEPPARAVALTEPPISLVVALVLLALLATEWVLLNRGRV